MTKDNLKTTSKYLSYILRHAPDSIGLNLDARGWARTDDLIEKSEHPLTRELIAEVVSTNAKQRFALSEDGNHIRANQGHSIQVDLALAEKAPPETLFHGTAEKHLASIRRDGLVKGSRHHVHLSSDTATATSVGGRHGKPVVLTVNSGDMARSGTVFYQSDNGVWLVDHVPPKFLVWH
ncbi:putative RNA 2'-phosphotransferase [Shimia isoporae]|uniref:Probable RNA 2'-phosphotransferase n=1 Tax=Shimia isoporae TaxID=647720 RepID=A0A4V2Q490_9RHOB|nr:RNA 2'-phosphotransferase [Shimia isoporae]TCL10250.1 putative RNA 2'-phosphotransferase [Shimia isoporae]